MDVQANVAVLEQVFQLKRACRYATLSSMLLLVYDYVITFSDEVNLVWNSPRSFAKATFFLNRYFSLFFVVTYTCLIFIVQPTNAICKAAFDLQAWSNWIGGTIVELLLQFWVFSVYQPGKRTCIFMTVLYIVLATSSAISLSVVLRTVRVEIEMPGCSLAAARDEMEIMQILVDAAQPRVPTLMSACMLPSVVYELVLLALLVYKEIQFVRCSSRSGRWSPVAAVLIRDSLTYFIIILIAYLTNAFIWTFAPSQLFQIGVGFGVALPSLLGSRLLLNLRGAHRRTHGFTSTVSLLHTTRWDHLFASSTAS